MDLPGVELQKGKIYVAHTQTFKIVYFNVVTFRLNYWGKLQKVIYHPFLQLCPDVGDSKTIEQVHQCDREGKYEAKQQEKLADEGKGVGGVGVDVPLVNLPDQHCHHLEKHSSRREV